MQEITQEYLASQGFSQNFPERFWKKVQKTDGCWIWIADITGSGYGSIVKGRNPGERITAHRASWILHNGPIPDGLHVLHNCPSGDNPKCVNPSHLWIGTAKDNLQDASKKGRMQHGERHYLAKLNPECVREIRKLYLTGLNWKQLGERFGVAGATARNVVIGKTWKHVIVCERDLSMANLAQADLPGFH